MSYELLKKAYKIDLEKISEGFLYSDFICYAETRNEAKTNLLKEVKYEGLTLKYTDEELNYLNIPVLRCKRADKLSFEGVEKTLVEIDEILTERKRLEVLQEILDNENIKFCYIRKGCYYRPNYCGYTDFKDAVKHAKGCRDIWLERIDIEEHNKLINEEIRELERRLIA
jgi:hypothetical protein